VSSTHPIDPSSGLPGVLQRRLRVLHAIGSVSMARGGPSAALFHTVEGLRRHGVDCEVVTTDDDGDGRRTPGVTHGAASSLDGISVRYFPQQTDFYAASWPLLQWLRRNVRHYDLVHCHGLFNFTPTAAAWTARSRAVPYVLTTHGVLESWGRQHRRPLLKRASIATLEGPLIERAAAVHFTSRKERQESQAACRIARAAVIPLAVPFDRCSSPDPGDPPVDAAFEPLRHAPWILYLARMHPVKGLENLLRAFALVARQTPGVQLVLAGDGPADYVASLRGLADTLGVAGCIHWPGFVSGERKDWLLRNCTVFALTSASENFGVAAVEAMAAERAVVVTPGVAIAEIVERWRAGCVASPDPQGIADALTRLLADREEAGHAGRRARSAVEVELSIDAHGREMAHLYRDILAQRVR
jgi:glycosyltransferase involved in cell wall biosynthesis